MSTKRILWVLPAFALAGILYAQECGAPPSTPGASQFGKSGTPDQIQMEIWTTGQAYAKGHAQGSVPKTAEFLMTEKEVVKDLKSASPESVTRDVKERGVDFDMTPAIEKKLRRAKATHEVIEAVRKAGPEVRSHMAKVIFGPGEAGTQGIPLEQAKALDAIQSELDPDKTIALVDDFAKAYPASSALSYVYSFGASSYEQKGDVEKVIEYTDKGLKMRPDNLMCLILKVGMMPQPQYLNHHEADKGKILKEAESEANHALQLISQLPRQPNEADMDYQKRLVHVASPVHGSLGMVHLELASSSLGVPDKKDELAKAEQELKTAVATTDRADALDYFRLGEAYALDGKSDDAIGAFMKAGEAGRGTVIKTYADQRVEELKKGKAMIFSKS